MKFPSVYEGKGFVSNGREFILITRKEKIFLLAYFYYSIVEEVYLVLYFS